MMTRGARFVCLLAVLGGCGGGGYYAPPSDSASAENPVIVNNAQTSVFWRYVYTASNGQLDLQFRNAGPNTVAFVYRATSVPAADCVGGTFDLQLNGTATIPPGETWHHPIGSGDPGTVYACVWGFQDAGTPVASPAPEPAPAPAPEPAPGPAISSELCYQHDCNGSNTGRQCFASRDAYCQSLCASSNCAAQIACSAECK